MEFKVGIKYKQKSSSTEVYYAGVNDYGRHVFELIDNTGATGVTLPKDYIPIGNNTYWSYEGIEREFILVEKDVPQYQVGKWYKAINGHNFYGKFLRLENKHVWSFVVSDRILNGPVTSNDEYGFNDGYTWALLEDLEEIQKFLPEGHMDKIQSKSLEGRYIEAMVDFPNGGSVKAGEIGIIRTMYNHVPYSVDFPKHSGYIINSITWKEGINYKLLPKDYVPESGQPQKLNSFSIGDYVVCLPEPNTNPVTNDKSKGGAGYKANLFFKIIDITGNIDKSILWGGEDTNGVYFNSARKATVDEISEYKRIGKNYLVTDIADKVNTTDFKVGDFVVVIQDGYIHFGLARIINIPTRQDYYFKLKSCSNGIVNSFCYKSNQFRKATEEEINKAHWDTSKPIIQNIRLENPIMVVDAYPVSKDKLVFTPILKKKQKVKKTKQQINFITK